MDFSWATWQIRHIHVLLRSGKKSNRDSCHISNISRTFENVLPFTLSFSNLKVEMLAKYNCSNFGVEKIEVLQGQVICQGSTSSKWWS